MDNRVSKIAETTRTAGLIAAVSLALSVGGCSTINTIKSLRSGAASSPAPLPYTVVSAPATQPPPVDTAPEPSPPANGDSVDSIVASVDGEPITSHDVKVFSASNAAAATQAGGAAPSVPEDPQAVLKELIVQRLLQQESQKYADRVTDEEIDHYIEAMKQKGNITEDQLRAQLQSQGVTYDEFRNTVRKQVQAMAMIDKEVRQKILITDAQVEAYYKEHPDEFTITAEKYQLAQILIAVPANSPPDQVEAARKKAEDLHKKAVTGADFGDLARQFSDDDSKSKGGELGEFSPSELNDSIAAAVAKLKAGDISDVVRTQYGFHIIKVEAHQKPGSQSLADVKPQIREKLLTEAAKGEFQKWVDRDLVKQHYVVTY
jgi:peptidyl-prolyl cis-trans isomerase SurA